MGGRLTLLKFVLQAIPIFWHSLDIIPKEVLEAIRKPCLNFLRAGKCKNNHIPLVKWNRIELPEEFGDWGLKMSNFFLSLLGCQKSLETIDQRGFGETVEQKYIATGYILDWIRNPRKSIKNVSNQWKPLARSLHIIGDYLAWKVGSWEKTAF